MTDKIDTPESVRMFARDLVPAIGHLFRHVEERDIGKMNLLLTLLERYAAHLEKCAGVWVPCSERMPGEDLPADQVFCESMVFCYVDDGWSRPRDLRLYDGKFSFWEDDTEAFPTHWLDVRPPGAAK